MKGHHTMAFIQIRGKTKDKLNRAYTRHAFMIDDGVFSSSRPSSSLKMISSNEELVSSSIPYMNGIDTTLSDVLSTQYIVIGSILAFIIAFGWSYLNGQSSSTSFVSWPSKKNGDDTLSEDITTSIRESDNENTFDAEDWKEMSREENYVLYNTKIRKSIDEKKPTQQLDEVKKKENKAVLIALLVLFIPIFSIEFFFALSRQFVCQWGLGGEAIVTKLCSPII